VFSGKFYSLSFDKKSSFLQNDPGMSAKCNNLSEENTVKKILSIILLLSIVFNFTFVRPVLAGDVASGAKIFSANCAACHAGGKNVVNPSKTLAKADLEKYGMNSLEAIVTQVTKGKAGMPAFKGRLNAQQIEDVATYVLESSAKGWKKV
jgi:cytochrome c6